VRVVLKLLLFLVILSLPLTKLACSQPSSDGAGVYTFTDSLGREVELNKTPTRVAILFSSYAEIWKVSGGEVAVTVADSVERGFAGSDAVIVDGGGGHTSIDTELLIAASPDFVVGTADYPIQVDVCELLASQGIPSALFKVESFEDYLEVLGVFTDILGTKDKYGEHGIAVKSKIVASLEKVRAYLAKNPEKAAKMLFIRAGSSQRSTKAKLASDNFACAMLEEIGLYNIANKAPVLLDGLSVEEIVISDPSWIFVSMMGEDEGAVKDNINSLFAKDGYSSVCAVVGGRVVFLPKNLFHYKPNHRWAEAYEYLIELLYPEVLP